MSPKLYYQLLIFFALPQLLWGLERPKFDFNKWFYLITPFWGEGYNSNQIPFRLFENKQSDFIIHQGNKSFSGSGKGSGIEFMAFNQTWQFLYVGFHFPMYCNQDEISFYNYFQSIKTEVSGHILSVRYKLLNYNAKKIIMFSGLSYFQGNGPHDTSIVNNFILYSYNTNQMIQIPKVSVNVYVEDPNPYIGISFKLPIQNWKIDAIYSYGFERVNTILKTSPAKSIDFKQIINDPELLFIYNYDFNNNIPPLQYTIRKKYYANRLGISLFMDYRRFISLRLTLRKDLTYNRWVSNAMFNLIFSQFAGLSLFYEYSERSVGTIRYWLIGPTFIFNF